MWMAIAAIASSVLSAAQSHQAAKAQEYQFKAQAKREEVKAREGEIDRKKKLIQALASQNAARGAQGIAANQGSPAAMMRSDLYEEERDQLVGAAGAEYRIGQSLYNADQANISGKFKVASSLLDMANTYTKRGKA